MIPDGIGGILVIPEASCGECAKIINKFEQPIMKTQFGMTRFANKISSKDKKRPKNYQSKQNYRFVDRELSDKECADWGINRKPIEGESEDFSACFGDAILMENYGESPGIFSGKSPDYEGSLRWSFFGEPGLSNSSTGGFVMRLERGRLERLLAKIAHSYAVHVLGIDGFTPYLPKFILEHTLKSNRYLIGSAEAKTTQALHRIQIFRANAARLNPPMLEPSPLPVVVCEIQIFCYIAPIAYQVVVGEPC